MSRDAGGGFGGVGMWLSCLLFFRVLGFFPGFCFCLFSLRLLVCDCPFLFASFGPIESWRSKRFLTLGRFSGEFLWLFRGRRCPAMCKRTS